MPRPHVSADSIARRARAVPPPFDCSWTDGGLKAAWVHLAGELDVDTTPQLEKALSAPDTQAPLIVLDMRDLAFMDSSGVHAIVNAGTRVRRLGRRLVIVRGPPEVDRVFALTGTIPDVEDGDVGPIDPSVQTLPRPGDTDDAS